LEIYKAVDAPKAFSIHDYTERKQCPVSCRIKEALDKALEKTQHAMEVSLKDISLAQVVSHVKKT
jgi:DNA-binding IscR family transcriptional regulator